MVVVVVIPALSVVSIRCRTTALVVYKLATSAGSPDSRFCADVSEISQMAVVTGWARRVFTEASRQRLKKEKKKRKEKM